MKRLLLFLRSLFQPKVERAPIVAVLERYDDFTIIGEWGTMRDGHLIEHGNLVGRTRKVMDAKGRVSLDREWMPDNAKEVTGFDPTTPTL